MYAFRGAGTPTGVAALILFATTVKVVADDDCPWGFTPEFFDLFVESIEAAWADPSGSTVVFPNPSLADNPRARAWYAKYFRLSASPSLVRTLLTTNVDVDVRQLLPLVKTPTLVLHRTDETWLRVEGSRYVVSQIPARSSSSCPGLDDYIWEQDAVAVVDEIEEFLTGVPAWLRIVANGQDVDVHRYRRLHSRGRCDGRRALATAPWNAMSRR